MGKKFVALGFAKRLNLKEGKKVRGIGNPANVRQAIRCYYRKGTPMAQTTHKTTSGRNFPPYQKLSSAAGPMTSPASRVRSLP
jgi:hypothetical protein